MKIIHPAFRPFPAALLSVTFACGCLGPPGAMAELANDSLLGPGLRSQPAYDGSASQRVEFVPVIRYLGEPWFARSTQGGGWGSARMGP